MPSIMINMMPVLSTLLCTEHGSNLVLHAGILVNFVLVKQQSQLCIKVASAVMQL